jgi:hypothetical protein
MPEDPNARFDHKDLSSPLADAAGTGTPRERHIGAAVAIGLMLIALLVIALLDHYGVIH